MNRLQNLKTEKAKTLKAVLGYVFRKTKFNNLKLKYAVLGDELQQNKSIYLFCSGWGSPNLILIILLLLMIYFVSITDVEQW